MFYASLCDQQEASDALVTLSEQQANLRTEMDVVATDNKSLRGSILISATARCYFFLF